MYSLPYEVLGAARYYYDTDNAWVAGYEQAVIDCSILEAKRVKP
jgi:hypothetical protein